MTSSLIQNPICCEALKLALTAVSVDRAVDPQTQLIRPAGLYAATVFVELPTIDLSMV